MKKIDYESYKEGTGIQQEKGNRNQKTLVDFEALPERNP